MFDKRTSPIQCAPLRGEAIEIGAKILPNEDIVTKESKKSNTFGHFPHSPRVFEKPPKHKNRKPIFRKAMDSLTHAYFDPWAYEIGHIFWHSNKIKKDGSYRKVRSERRESLATRVGHCIIHHVNLATWALGYFDRRKKEFVYYDYDYIAKVTKCSYSAVERTMRHFISKGYVEVSQRHQKNPDGSFKSLSPIIKINQRFFTDLGIDPDVLMFYVKQSEEDLKKEKQKSEYKNKIPLFEPKPYQPKRKERQFIRSEKTRSLSEIMMSLTKAFNTS